MLSASPFSLTQQERETLVQTIIDDVDRVIKSENNVEAGRLTNEGAYGPIF